MIKSFYKKQRPVKNFFVKNMKLRSTAYGSEVAREFSDWRKYFNERWNNPAEEFLLSAQGGIDGSPSRAAYPVSGIKGVVANAPAKKTNSCLTPLNIDGLYLEVGKDGFVIVNSSVTPVNIGVEHKAWAIASISVGRGVKNVLFVIAKPLGSSSLSLSAYGLTSRGVEKEALASVKMENTLDAYSHLVCMGRHVFAVHKSTLNYFYFIPETNELERVDIGGEIKFVQHCIAADDGGRVYWISDNDVYGITIGFPANYVHIKGEDGKRINRIQCTGESLLVFAADKRNACVCYEYPQIAEGRLQKRIFTTDAESVVMLGNRAGSLQYIKISRTPREGKAQLAVNDGSFERIISEQTFTGEKAFYIDGFLVGNAAYARLDKSNKITAINR